MDAQIVSVPANVKENGSGRIVRASHHHLHRRVASCVGSERLEFIKCSHTQMVTIGLSDSANLRWCGCVEIGTSLRTSGVPRRGQVDGGDLGDADGLDLDDLPAGVEVDLGDEARLVANIIRAHATQTDGDGERPPPRGESGHGGRDQVQRVVEVVLEEVTLSRWFRPYAASSRV